MMQIATHTQNEHTFTFTFTQSDSTNEEKLVQTGHTTYTQNNS